jgi:hypothetical protein
MLASPAPVRPQSRLVTTSCSCAGPDKSLWRFAEDRGRLVERLRDCHARNGTGREHGEYSHYPSSSCSATLLHDSFTYRIEELLLKGGRSHMAIKLPPTTKRLVASIKRTAENLDEEIGDLKAGLLLDYCLERSARRSNHHRRCAVGLLLGALPTRRRVPRALFGFWPRS